MPDSVLAALRAVVGDRHVLVDADARAGYEVDWTRRFGGRALAVVRPADAEQVAGVLRACARAGVGVVPQGGNTGLVGGSVPRGAAHATEREPAAGGAGAGRDVPAAGGEPPADGRAAADPDAPPPPIVLSLARLDDLGAVDQGTLQVEAGAGVTLAALQQRADAAGLDAAVDLGARDSATLGGLVACDAGGVRSLRHGTVRARVAGLEAVLADGSIVRRLSGLLKDNAGYDLPSLLIGSEGTLGVVTRVRWRLVERRDARVLALVGLPSLADAARVLAVLRPRLSGALDACEFITDDGLALVLDHLRIPVPLRERSPAYLLIGCAAATDPTAELADALQAAGIDDALVATDRHDRERLWRLREAHTEAIAAAGVAHKLDVGVPLDRLPAFAAAVRDTLAALAPDARVVLFGHIGDGNVHVNVLGLAADDDTVDGAILRLAADHGGTISAEHGIGVAKAPWLHLVRSPAEIAAMRAIKQALDPAGLLNPGAVLPDE